MYICLPACRNACVHVCMSLWLCNVVPHAQGDAARAGAGPPLGAARGDASGASPVAAAVPPGDAGSIGSAAPPPLRAVATAGPWGVDGRCTADFGPTADNALADFGQIRAAFCRRRSLGRRGPKSVRIQSKLGPTSTNFGPTAAIIRAVFDQIWASSLNSLNSGTHHSEFVEPLS